jgi:hypothetical protein
LMPASQELASSVLKCKIHDMEHWSGHRAIETSFHVDVPEYATQPRLLFKNAPWNAIRGIDEDGPLVDAGGMFRCCCDIFLHSILID